MSACDAVAYTSLKPSRFLYFNGINHHVEIGDRDQFSIPTTGALTVSARIRPDVLAFPKTEESGYVHVLGKAEGYRSTAQNEWLFRMYSEGNGENRGNRISFYVFDLRPQPTNPENHGNGSYFQDSIVAGEWIHIVGVADMERTYLYKNGVLRDCDKHKPSASGSCDPPFIEVTPQNGAAPVRIGTSNFESFFKGAIREVRIWGRALTAEEVGELYRGLVPRDSLVGEFLLTEDLAPDTAAGSPAEVRALWREQ
jgi:hypothetical protein